MTFHGRFERDGGTAVLDGNELLFKGCLEAGAALITGYPGSPLADIFVHLAANAELLRRLGIRATQANNEAQAAAMLNGAQDAGADAVAFMKSVGLHVAADALAITNYAGTSETAGSLVVVGDDPALSSTQVGVDSRWLLRHLQIPILAPSSFQETKDGVALGLEASRSSGLVAGFWITTPLAEGGGTVELRPNQHPRVPAGERHAIDTSRIDLARRVNLPPNSNRNEAEILGPRRERLHEWARRAGIDSMKAENSPTSTGFVVSGVCTLYLHEALAVLGLAGRVRVLKLGLVYPLEPDGMHTFLRGLSDVFVVEEKGGFIESQVRDLAKAVPGIKVWGKQFRDGPGVPETGGLSVGRLVRLLGNEPGLRRLAEPLALRRGLVRMDKALGRTQTLPNSPPAPTDAPHGLLNAVQDHGRGDAPPRTPTFCPGCPHRDTLAALTETNRKLQAGAGGGGNGKDRLPAFPGNVPKSDKSGGMLFHGDIGCYSMAFLPPFHTMHNLSGMGLGGATGAGADPFVSNPQVVLMGDSTFFHSGLLAISNSIKENQNLTYIILDNKNTAMTGHQGTPASDTNLMGERVPPQEIERIVHSLHPELPVYRVNPSDREDYVRLLERITPAQGVKVVIADKECAITRERRARWTRREKMAREGFLPRERHVNIVPEVCEFCLACTRATGCPGLTFEHTADGPKVAIDRSACVTDGACTTFKACPSFERIVVDRRGPPVAAPLQLREAPVPLVSFTFPWRMMAAGVGGMGLGILTRVLATAAEREGFRVSWLDRKGLAIRSGGVEAHLTLSRAAEPVSPSVPEGRADLLLGLEPLEAIRILPQAHDRTAAVVNNHLTPTVRMLTGEDTFPETPIPTLEARLGRVISKDFSNPCEEHIGSKVYSNMALLGAAYQAGLLPIRETSILEVIRELFTPAEAERNVRAFKIGRSAVLEQSADELWPADTPGEVLDRRSETVRRSFLTPWRARREARAFRSLAEGAASLMGLPAEPMSRFLHHAADLTEFDGAEAARLYVETVTRVYLEDAPHKDWSATRATIENLYHCLLVKDEVYVAHLLTRPEKYERDRRRFGLSSRDRIRYVHVNRPRFALFGRVIEFDLDARDWMLRALKHARFLRRLLPGWHARERQFSEWYLSEVVGGFLRGEFPSYEAAVEALRVPETVRGYREIRYRSMEPAFEKVAQLRMKRAAGS